VLVNIFGVIYWKVTAILAARSSMSVDYSAYIVVFTMLMFDRLGVTALDLL
jgi:hypothetical protein